MEIVILEKLKLILLGIW